jgi:hypothetical protein
LAKHVRWLGILWIAVSAFRILGAGAVFLVGNLLIGRAVGHHGPPAFVPAILSFVGFFLLAGSVFGFAAGWGLLQRRAWARTLALILGVISLLDFPLGTALGGYTLWVLLPSRAEEEYRWIAGTA